VKRGSTDRQPTNKEQPAAKSVYGIAKIVSCRSDTRRPLPRRRALKPRTLVPSSRRPASAARPPTRTAA
jgi:hypothetical protein